MRRFPLENNHHFLLTLFFFFARRWTEPIILLLILFHFVVLSIQSARSLVLASPGLEPSQTRGYFHQWEDYALFALFIFFTYVNLRGFIAAHSPSLP